MAADRISPEERLFKVIRKMKESSDGDSPAGGPRAGMLEKARAFFRGLRHNDLIGEEAVALGGAGAFMPRLRELDLPVVNRVLAVALAVAAASIAYYAMTGRPDIARVTAQSTRLEELDWREEKIKELEPLEVYAGEASRRDIFRPYSPGKKERDFSPSIPGAKEELKKRMENLVLRGISWGEYPRAMIWHEKEDRMYFLRPGQIIGNTGLHVKNISRQEVTLAYEGEEAKLM